MAAIVSAIFLVMRFSWLFYSLILVFLGGIIVIFIYATSLSIKNKNIFYLIQQELIVAAAVVTLISIKSLVEPIGLDRGLMRIIFNNLRLTSLYIKAIFLLLCLLVVVKAIS